MPFNRYPYELPPLPYAYNALEPYINEETMYYHHDKLFQAYVDNLNFSLRNNPRLQRLNLTQLLRMQRSLPINIGRYAGGVYNHTVFFNHLSPATSDGHTSSGDLLQLINRTFHSVERFKQLFTQEAMRVFGSGWTFLTITPQRTLRIVNKANQNTPLADNERPIIMFDIWEHAYYLQYKNLRVDYINNLWNVITFPII